MVASTQQHRARLQEYYPRPPIEPSFVKLRTLRPLISYFFYFNNKYCLSLYVYTRGMLGCLLGFWPLIQKPARPITVYELLLPETGVEGGWGWVTSYYKGVGQELINGLKGVGHVFSFMLIQTPPPPPSTHK